jgi:hypothetical protein
MLTQQLHELELSYSNKYKMEETTQRCRTDTDIFCTVDAGQV